MDVTRTVYGLYYPETRRVVEALWEERPHAWYEQNYTGRQDPMHRGCLDRWRAWAGAAGVLLGDDFPFEAPTAGASEAIHALLALHRAGGARRIHVLEGEYEGYGVVGAALGLEVAVHAREGAVDSIERDARPGDRVWISQPSAIDGNLWPGLGELIDRVERRTGARVIVDLTYVGAVADAVDIDLRSPAVEAVVWSLSKPFGVYYHRVGGLLARAELATLRGHHWFKNLFSVHLGERLMAAHPALELPGRYREVQRRALEQAREAGLVPASARPSDVVMLAHAPAADASAYPAFTRGGGLRFCLSPSMDRMIQP